MTAVEERTKGMELDAAERALNEAEQAHGRDGLALREPIEKLAEIYSRDGLCGKAELLYKRLVDIVSKAADPVQSLNALSKLAAVYRWESKFDDAEAVYLDILTRLGDAPDAKRQIAETLCCLAGVYVHKKEFGQAQNTLGKALQLFADSLGAVNNYASWCHIALATIDKRQGKNGDAEEQFAQSEVVVANAESGDSATDQGSLIHLAQEYYRQNRLNEVEMLLEQTIFSQEQRLWPRNARVGHFLHDRGELYLAQARFSDAEKAFKRALEIRTECLGQAHPDLAQTAMSLGVMYVSQSRFSDAEPVLKQAMKSRVLVFGVEHPSVAAAIETYVSVLKGTKRQSIALKLEARARDIRTKLVWLSERAAAAGRPPSQ